ncbi:MAG: A/G-specific adenine glycosylase [Bacilli bacterium]|nr:A/G-specific adenine glycosylase [Bacilli bacterium]
MQIGLADKIVDYYLKQGRALPWRKDQSPYCVHLSETMLQQTRVETVIPYFERFMEAFPTVFDLANAEAEKVLKLWEGLGYYSRAKNLHKAAIEVVNRYGGEYPRDKEGLLSLPGVGEYTANAIMAFCFDEKEIPVDGNFLRLFARLSGYGGNVMESKAKKECEAYFKEELGDALPSAFAQGAMEIGEVLCLPSSSPRCEECPLKEYCFAYANKKQAELPLRLVKTSKKQEKKTVLIYRLCNEYGYQKRPDSGLLSGLYGFPMEEGHLGLAKVKALLKEKGVKAKSVKPSIEYTHVFSHVKWDMKSYIVELKEMPEGLDLVFVSKAMRQESFALPSAFLPFEKASD